MKTESNENEWKVVFQQLKIAIARGQYLEIKNENINAVAENKKKIEKMGLKVSHDNRLIYWDLD